MRALLSAQEAKKLDRYSIDSFGMDSMVLMERAACEVTAAIKELVPNGRRVFCLAGVGNNGADGLAVARMLHRLNYEVYVLAIGDTSKATAEWKKQEALLLKLGIPVCCAQEAVNIPKSYDVYIDALFGIGLKREITGLFLQAIRVFQKAARRDNARVIAIDICSGVDSTNGNILGEAVRADLTVSFGHEKLGQYLYPGAACSKEVKVVDIGLAPLRLPDGDRALESEPVYLAEKNDAYELLLPRDPDGNKGSFGRVLVIAGSVNMGGAACFCTEAAYRMGAGLVCTVIPGELTDILQVHVPEAILSVYERNWDRDEIREQIKKAEAIVIGPGLGKSKKIEDLLNFVLDEHENIPLVIDADALNLLSESKPRDLGQEVILTPHPGELSRLLKLPVSQLKGEGQRNAGERLYKEWNCTAVCKDSRTLVCTEGKYCYISGGNDAMATGGSGDVLAGVLGGLLARGYSAKEAALFGTLIHAMAGDEAAATLGHNAVLARDLINALPVILKKIENQQ